MRKGLLAIIILTVALLAACNKNEPINEVNPDIIFDTEEHEDALTVHFFDLVAEDRYEKTGESMLITTPEGKTILIDAGKPIVGPLINEYLDKLGIDKIDYIMPSHPHSDHIGGYLTLFDEKEIGEVIQINLPHEESNVYLDYAEKIEENNYDVTYAEEGDVFEIEKDVTLEIMNPMEGLSADTYAFGTLSAGIINDVSMVVKMTYKDKSFLFTGDIYRGVENSLISKFGEALDVDLVVAPHHGLGTSSSTEFIEATNPALTIIPTNVLFDLNIIKKYEEAESDVYVSKYDGNILIRSKGKKIDVFREFEREDLTVDDPDEVDTEEE